MMEYNVPEEIISKIPSHFWPAFAGELISTFGLMIFDKDEDGFCELDCISSTNGWNAALRMTCTKLDMKWLYDYYDKLEWWQSDMFDGEIEDLLMKNFVESRDRPWNKYYQWMIKSEDR